MGVASLCLLPFAAALLQWSQEDTIRSGRGTKGARCQAVDIDWDPPHQKSSRPHLYSDGLTPDDDLSSFISIIDEFLERWKQSPAMAVRSSYRSTSNLQDEGLWEPLDGLYFESTTLGSICGLGPGVLRNHGSHHDDSQPWFTGKFQTGLPCRVHAATDVTRAELDLPVDDSGRRSLTAVSRNTRSKIGMETELSERHLEHACDSANEAETLVSVEDAAQQVGTLSAAVDDGFSSKTTSIVHLEPRSPPLAYYARGLCHVTQNADSQSAKLATHFDKRKPKTHLQEPKVPDLPMPHIPAECVPPDVPEDAYTQDYGMADRIEGAELKTLAAETQPPTAPSPLITDACELLDLTEDTHTAAVMQDEATIRGQIGSVSETSSAINQPVYRSQYSEQSPPTASSRERELFRKDLKERTCIMDYLPMVGHSEDSVCSSVTPLRSSPNSRRELDEDARGFEYGSATPILPTCLWRSSPTVESVDSTYRPRMCRPQPLFSLTSISGGLAIDCEDSKALAFHQTLIKKATFGEHFETVFPTSSTAQCPISESKAADTKDELGVLSPAWNAVETAVSGGRSSCSLHYRKAPISRTDELKSLSRRPEEDHFLTEIWALCDEIFANIRSRRLQSNQPQERTYGLQCASTTTGSSVEEKQAPTLSAQLLRAKVRVPYRSEDRAEESDNRHQEWDGVRSLRTEEERYKAVHRVWKNTSITDPQHDVTVLKHRRRLRLPNSQKLVKPARNYRKRKASSEWSSLDNSKLRRMDTAVFDSKIKRAMEVKERDLRRAAQKLRIGLHSIHHEMKSSVGHRDYTTKYRKCELALSTGTNYVRLCERRVREEFEDSDWRIRDAYRVTMDKLLAARDEVLHFNRFYSGLQDTDPRMLTAGQAEDQEKTQQLIEYFHTFYRAPTM